MKTLRYRKDERELMLLSGFPLCYDKRHCNACIGLHRRIVELQKQGFRVHNHVKHLNNKDSK